MNLTSKEREKIKKHVEKLRKLNHENVIEYHEFLTEDLGLNRICHYLLTKYYKVFAFLSI